MKVDPDRNLENEKQELLSKYNDDELKMYKSILEESRYLVNEPITIIEIRSEVGTDGE